MKICKNCEAKGDIWISEEGLCPICNHEKHKWEKENLHHYGYCFICTGEIWTPSTNEMHFLWTDAGWFGLPICFECFEILRWLVPEKIDVPIKRKKPKKRGLEIWL